MQHVRRRLRNEMKLHHKRLARFVIIVVALMPIEARATETAVVSLRPGQLASEVARLIDDEHRKLGGAGSTFCIVSFGVDTSLPHGGKGDRALRDDDVVLIDTGTQIDGAQSADRLDQHHSEPVPPRLPER